MFFSLPPQRMLWFFPISSDGPRLCLKVSLPMWESWMLNCSLVSWLDEFCWVMLIGPTQAPRKKTWGMIFGWRKGIPTYVFPNGPRPKMRNPFPKVYMLVSWRVVVPPSLKLTTDQGPENQWLVQMKFLLGPGLCSQVLFRWGLFIPRWRKRMNLDHRFDVKIEA